MSEVEDVAGAAIGGAQNLLDAQFENFERGEESDGIEVALDSVRVSDGAPAVVQEAPRDRGAEAAGRRPGTL